MTEAQERKFTKKEKKALAFRAAKGKGKAAAPSFDDEVAAIDNDAADDADDAEDRQLHAKPNKKRKRDDQSAAAAAETEAGTGGAAAVEGGGDDDEQPQQKKKKRQRGKTQAQRDREARLAAQGQAGAQAEDGHRKLLFVGTSGQETPHAAKY